MLNVIRTARQLIDSGLQDELDGNRNVAILADPKMLDTLIRLLGERVGSVYHRDLHRDLLQLQRDAGWAPTQGEDDE